MRIAPFDFAALPKVSRAEIWAREQLRSARGLVPLPAIAGALERIAGAPVSIAATRALPFDPAASLPIGVTIAPASDPDNVLLVEVEPALARELVARALKLPPGAPADPRRAPGAEVEGAFAAVLLAALRASETPLRLVSGAELPARAVSVLVAVTVAGATFEARVTFPPLRVSAKVPEVDLARLGDAPIALRVVATSCLATRAEIAALEPGDVFLPPKEWLEGPVDLVAADEERGLSARLAFGSKVVLRTEPPATHPMTTESKAPLDVALDVPVVVRVELGSVEMKAREWAALSEGDVISTGVKVGSHAVLRIGGVAVAHGELVNVEGETGVRIVGTIKR